MSSPTTATNCVAEAGQSDVAGCVLLTKFRPHSSGESVLFFDLIRISPKVERRVIVFDRRYLCVQARSGNLGTID
jgi:hypothetical protein